MRLLCELLNPVAWSWAVGVRLEGSANPVEYPPASRFEKLLKKEAAGPATSRDHYEPNGMSAIPMPR